MAKHRTYTETDLRYLRMLSRMFPTVRAAATEIINLNAILNLPKGCEHFISDLHGEHEAFLHILNSCSGVIRERLDLLFKDSIPRAQLDQLATLIYYPEEKMEDNTMPKKSPLSMQIDVSRFEKATEEEKRQQDVMSESTTFFKDGMRKLMKNPLAVASMIVLILIIVTIIFAPIIVPYSYEEIIKVNGKRDM